MRRSATPRGTQIAVTDELEKLGSFYLGRRFDPSSGAATEEPILYDAKDLTTHAFVVGMTGSGKTGLCVSLIEEAAIDGVPAICIDPKGDLGNLLLTFPELRPEDFEPWVDPAEATRKGRTVADHAKATAELWRDGLARWGQSGERIRRLREKTELALYTPGSRAGRPLSVLSSLAPPSAELPADARAGHLKSTASAVLALAGIEAAPHEPSAVFLGALLEHFWKSGSAVDLGAIVRALLDPPIQRVGVLDLDTFFDANARRDLAMRLNGVLASPGFADWSTGEPLDVGKLLHGESGRPRVSVINIAHMADQERMSFVTLLLGEVLAWARKQPGTGSLRAILYMDEVFGYLPPIGEPPSKAPLLTLLKQARAHGLGLVLATQNPVDVDYKALSNCGTWMLGRLQTERDVARVVDGLRSAAGGSEPAELRTQLAGLKSRVFLMRNVHDDRPVLFHTRWALSYLRGPLTREHIEALAPEAPAAADGAAPIEEAPPPEAERPAIPEHLSEVFFGEPIGDVRYTPKLLATVELHYANARSGVDEWKTLSLLAPVDGDGPRWDRAEAVTVGDHSLGVEPAPGAAFGAIPPALLKKTGMKRAASSLKKHVYQHHPLELGKCKDPKLVAEPGEDRATFEARVRLAMREERDRDLGELREKYAKKLAKVQARIERAEAKVETQQAQVEEKKLDTALSVGTTVLGALFGRRTSVLGHASRASTAAKRAKRIQKEKQDVVRARAAVADLQGELRELEAELQAELAERQVLGDPEIDVLTIRPRKGDLDVSRLVLAWVPV